MRDLQPVVGVEVSPSKCAVNGVAMLKAKSLPATLSRILLRRSSRLDLTAPADTITLSRARTRTVLPFLPSSHSTDLGARPIHLDPLCETFG